MALRSYFIRLTPHNDLTLTTVEQVVTMYTNKYVISREGSPETSPETSLERRVKTHYHVAIWNCVMSTETLRARLKKHFDAQIYISGKEIEDKIRTIAYTIKDGNYKSSGLDVNDFLMAKAVSKPKVKFDDLIKEVECKYLKGGMTEKEMTAAILDAYIKCNRKVYVSHIKAQALLIKLKKETNRSSRELIIEKIIDEI